MQLKASVTYLVATCPRPCGSKRVTTPLAHSCRICSLLEPTCRGNHTLKGFRVKGFRV